LVHRHVPNLANGVGANLSEPQGDKYYADC
jgi:hypothetical protein